MSQTRKNYVMLNTLIDLDIQNDIELNALGPEYANLLERKTKIIDEYNKAPKEFDRFVGVLTDLYVDFNKMKGGNDKLRVPELVALITDYEYNSLVSFFNGEIESH